jgi:hypothetical protein
MLVKLPKAAWAVHKVRARQRHVLTSHLRLFIIISFLPVVGNLVNR